MKPLVFLDTETNDINEKVMIQFAWIKSSPVIFAETKEFFIKTDKKINLEALAIHHITPKILEQKGKNLEDVKDEINSFLSDSILIAHNADFDKEVLIKNGFDVENFDWIDTYTVAYELLQDPGMKHSLQYLRYYFELEFDNEINPHDALSDVIVLEWVFNQLFDIFSLEWMNNTSDKPFSIIEEMIKITKRWIILRQFAFWKYAWKTFEEVAKIDRWYLEWLLNSEIQKEQKNKHMINTLNFYLK